MMYIHQLPGRIRVRVAHIKGHTERAAALEEWLRGELGVERAQVNPLTGSVLVHYQVGVADPDALLVGMRRHGMVGDLQRRAKPARAPRHAGIRREVAKVVFGSAAQLLLERSVFALIAAVL